MILLNTLVIGAEVQHNASQRREESHEVFYVASQTFAVVFAIELAMRLLSEGPRKFLTSTRWGWNVFDLVVVSLSVLDAISDIVGSVKLGGQSVSQMRMV